jgi:serine/threonine protein kinase
MLNRGGGMPSQVGATLADVKLGDLGAARNVKSKEEYTYIATTDHMPARWLPLEAIRDAAFSHKSDVFSFGVLMWEVSGAASLFVIATAKHADRSLATHAVGAEAVGVRSG